MSPPQLLFVLCITFAQVSSANEPASTANLFASSEGEDRGWPFIRGPNYDGHSPEVRLADSWPESGPPVLWTRELGQGYSSFAAWDDRVATQVQTLAGQRVVCMLFVATCVTYFMLCRRLSLVFEWVFLCGFAAAAPFAIAGWLCFRNRQWWLAWQTLMTVLAFAAFHWSSAAVLWWKN